ncbi:SpoIIE family protein phosphatase [Streptomyces sp. RB6PN25]|uniref:SpoIIE family protein phosphatase n=1 Tax=Streptomyces humicola TaxID=2953240 RepID=A0ABT1PTM4_9ACTN|nr:SpoIIE family protein phosphatase [Streptomyces humicola]MCQ4081024.1 SpoIIE family protein phosphatase [Streptomyces humicola]
MGTDASRPESPRRDASQPPGRSVLLELVEGTTAGIGILDTELRYLYVNPALAVMNGVPAADHTGRTVAEVLPELDAREDVLRAVLADGRPREVTSSGQTQAAFPLDRRYFHGAYHRLEEGGTVIGIVGIVVEVTASHQQQRDLERARQRLALLDKAATRIGTSLDMDTTCRELAEFLVPVLADVATVEVVPPEQADAPRPYEVPGGMPLRLRRAAMASVPKLRGRVEVFGTAGEYVEYQEDSSIPNCLRNGEPVLLNLLDDEELGRQAPNVDRVALYREIGIHSALVVPLTARGHPIGTVTMVRAGDSPAFTSENVVAAQDLAGRAAISLDNARRYTREHGIAVELQRALLSEPGSPHPDVEVAFRYQPAGSSALVGGDWYDTVRLPYGRTLLALGDVMGHGVEASVDMSQYRSMLRFVASADLPPHRILRRLDTMIAESERDRPATCVLALTDPARGRCSFASAGHLPPAILGTDDHTELLDLPVGPPLGTGIGGYELVTAELEPGRVVLLYTDGLIERRGEDIDVSLGRLSQVSLPSEGGLDALLDRLLSMLVPGPAEDDVAVLAARFRRGRAGLAPHAT